MASEITIKETIRAAAYVEENISRVTRVSSRDILANILTTFRHIWFSQR